MNPATNKPKKGQHGNRAMLRKVEELIQVMLELTRVSSHKPDSSDAILRSADDVSESIDHLLPYHDPDHLRRRREAGTKTEEIKDAAGNTVAVRQDDSEFRDEFDLPRGIKNQSAYLGLRQLLSQAHEQALAGFAYELLDEEHGPSLMRQLGREFARGFKEGMDTKEEK